MTRRIRTLGTAVVPLLLTVATPAQAYVGPGAGLAAIGAFLALIASVVVALVAFIWFPIRRLLRKMRGVGAVDAEALDEEA